MDNNRLSNPISRINDMKRGRKVKNTWTGWRYAALIGGIVGIITLGNF